jgi:hypothetical protein
MMVLSSCAVAAIACFTSEVFPTRIRATGSGIAAFSARIAGIITPLFAGEGCWQSVPFFYVLGALQLDYCVLGGLAGALLDVWPTSLLYITGVSAIGATVCNVLLPVETKDASVA